MQIKISESHILDSNGLGWQLRLTGTNRTIANFGGLPGVATYLVAKRIIQPDAVQLGWAVENLACNLANGFRLLCPDHPAAVKREASIHFGQGRFRIIANGPGGFHLLNPTKDVPRLKDQFKGEPVIVGYPSSVKNAFRRACECVLQTQPGEVSYTNLNAVYLELAQTLLADAVATFTDSPEQHPVKPDAARYLPPPLTPAQMVQRHNEEVQHAECLKREVERRQRWTKKRQTA